MLTNAAPQPVEANELVTVQGFSMYFTDVNNDEYNTEDEIKYLTGKYPEMIDVTQSEIITPYNIYIKSSALDAFYINTEVPQELQARVSYDVVSPDSGKNNTNDEQDNNEPAPENTEPQENNEPETAAIKAAEETVTYNTDSSGKAAVLPIAVRMKIPRKTQLLASIWDKLEEAEDPTDLFNTFSKYGTIWVRSSAAREFDTNLFTAINNKGSSVGATAADCVRAFIYNENGEDYLYLDFIVLISDAKSKNEGRTAYIEIFKDDNVPYILIGDGLMNKRWELAFYVGQTGDNPTPSSVYEETSENAQGRRTNSLLTGGSGEGCNSGIFGLGLLTIIMALKFKY